MTTRTDTVTREDMERLRAMLSEMETLAVEIMAPTPKIQTIFYKDYKTGKGIPKVDVGLDGGLEEETRLKEMYLALADRRAAQIERLENYLEDVDNDEMRTILRLYYRDGLTQDKIAHRLGYSKQAISYKLNAFWLTQKK